MRVRLKLEVWVDSLQIVRARRREEGMEGGEKGYMRDGAREGQGPGTANTIARGGRERSKWSLRRVGRTRGESKQL